MWTIVTRPRFDQWFYRQTDRVQEEMLAVLTLLQQDGPNLGRPQVDTLKGSAYGNMKELRVQTAGHPIRACFAFDPHRQAIVLCAADKKGMGRRFYQQLIKTAMPSMPPICKTLENE
ncbi:Uncharacterized protein conserved in bacteria [Serratia odorifera]|uniref:Uncharacterized protein conserved in bacteria n=1 Tax=Serratia odorifera TaxID=618 RepID=A0A3S4DIE4_SEROD|nr:type II toxin-antitoxin system RelE/ParE family toxin [Serratia odorifera]VDZ55854.1 Uncharacterized protein conserved in bacteria [Serratia odorifera]